MMPGILPYNTPRNIYNLTISLDTIQNDVENSSKKIVNNNGDIVSTEQDVEVLLNMVDGGAQQSNDPVLSGYHGFFLVYNIFQPTSISRMFANYERISLHYKTTPPIVVGALFNSRLQKDTHDICATNFKQVSMWCQSKNIFEQNHFMVSPSENINIVQGFYKLSKHAYLYKLQQVQQDYINQTQGKDTVSCLIQ
ncbi:hypothetical protein PPL_00251 [Heterostelium album PN500]|uniref:Uncharacterized protein n=1 Tax=Heterostelium pallidum (strain ATCC 26659 / Pp 5 / PN500) TaxID=670386 RepID=D3AVY5_HETP5|nr:hypothetical protein PPL_00251 [Heterostelium album PN500]EFA86458.1 hypothetical protein PPL_00251 [Heterostelium album PN500]|eukprot:XP_020438563.1 hypothetical protein PPL_00251 [Heterostelium album PN500]